MRAIVTVTLLALGCAHGQRPSEKCPERPACMTSIECHYDEQTQCSVCQCSAGFIDQGSEPPPGQPPFPNH